MYTLLLTSVLICYPAPVDETPVPLELGSLLAYGDEMLFVVGEHYKDEKLYRLYLVPKYQTRRREVIISYDNLYTTDWELVRPNATKLPLSALYRKSKHGK